MLKRLVNEARFQVEIEATGPLLVKSGYATLTGPDMTPVLTFRNGEPQVYIPGASLKGTFRSHVERVINTLRPNEVVVSDPFEKTGPRQAAGTWFNDLKKQYERQGKHEDDLNNALVYRNSCPVTRLFGSTWFIGRVSIGDAYIPAGTKLIPTERRDGVGIDRLTGGAAQGAKFELEVVSPGTRFVADVLLRNFECWQLGALLLVVQDMEDELIRIGSGKSRGLGSVKAHVTSVALHRFATGNTQTTAQAQQVWGLGKYVTEQENYGTAPDDVISVDGAPAPQLHGIRSVQTLDGAALIALKQAAIADFVKRMAVYPAYKQREKL